MECTNKEAEVVIIGVTPGNTQHKGSRKNKSPKEIKQENSFASGNMRGNLTSMLDSVGMNEVLGIDSCESIFNEHFDKVESTSLLKDATFEVNKKGEEKMFNKPSKILKYDKLTKEFEEGFLEDSKKCKKAKVMVALGKETEALLKQQQAE